MQLPVLSFESCGELKTRLQEDGVLFSAWPAFRLDKLWDDYRQKEIRFLDYDGHVCVEQHKIRLRILAKRPEGLRFLQESRFCPNEQKFLPRSESTSVSGKLRLYRDNPECVFSCTERELGEELKLKGMNVKRFTRRYRERVPELPRESTSCKGLYRLVTKHGLEWLMEPSFQRPEYIEEARYGTSRFDWIPIPVRIQQELAERKQKRSAA